MSLRGVGSRTKNIIGDHSKYTEGRQKTLLRWKEEKEQIELVTTIINGMPQQIELKINSDTHSKIVVSTETISALIDFAKKGNECTVLGGRTFDDIIQDLLKRGQRQSKSL
ncbi:MAG: hypothetical protein ACRD8Z_23470 [Nitrososphaeraceae archaeon]